MRVPELEVSEILKVRVVKQTPINTSSPGASHGVLTTSLNAECSYLENEAQFETACPKAEVLPLDELLHRQEVLPELTMPTGELP